MRGKVLPWSTFSLSSLDLVLVVLVLAGGIGWPTPKGIMGHLKRMVPEIPSLCPSLREVKLAIANLWSPAKILGSIPCTTKSGKLQDIYPIEFYLFSYVMSLGFTQAVIKSVAHYFFFAE